MFDPKIEYDSPDSWATKLKALRCVRNEFKDFDTVKELSYWLDAKDVSDDVFRYFVPDIKVCLTTNNDVFIKLPYVVNHGKKDTENSSFVVTQEQFDQYNGNT